MKTTLENFKFADKHKGCLFGVAVGDALGWPLEFMSIGEIRKEYSLKQ